MKKIIDKCSYVFFILIAFLIVTSWQSISQGQECISGIYSERDENGTDYCPSDYPVFCCSCVDFCFCCPESHPDCGFAARSGCCKCTSETIYKDNEEALTLLREFRDKVLSQSPIGQELIELYYQWSPAIVEVMEEDEEFKEEVKEMIDGVLELIGGGVE